MYVHHRVPVVLAGWLAPWLGVAVGFAQALPLKLRSSLPRPC
jgi:hypothetical protein